MSAVAAWRKLEESQWRGLSAGERRAALGELGALIEPEARVVDDPRPGADPGACCLELVELGVVLRPVPGGRAGVGLSEGEEQALRALAEEEPEAAVVLDYLAMAAPQARPVREVQVEPFLLAVDPLGDEVLARLLGGEATGGLLPGCLSGAAAEGAVEQLARWGLRLPAEAEWEHAYRAGSTDPFPWGASLPDSPFAPANRFGFDGMGELCELCADGWSPSHEDLPADGRPRPLAEQGRVGRGGAAATWPWQGAGEWTALLSANRFRAAELDGFLALRPAVGPARRAQDGA